MRRYLSKISIFGQNRSEPSGARDPLVQGFKGEEVDLGECGKGLDGVAQYIERDTGTDGERRLLQPLARLRTQRVGAGQALPVAQQGDESVRGVLRARVGLGLRDLRQ